MILDETKFRHPDDAVGIQAAFEKIERRTGLICRLDEVNYHRDPRSPWQARARLQTSTGFNVAAEFVLTVRGSRVSCGSIWTLGCENIDAILAPEEEATR